jgi:hypothetical protein
MEKPEKHRRAAAGYGQKLWPSLKEYIRKN